jgi:hypothetical protein
MNNLNGSIFYIEEMKFDKFYIGYADHNENCKKILEKLQEGNWRKLRFYNNKIILSSNIKKNIKRLRKFYENNKIRNNWYKIKTSSIDNIFKLNITHTQSIEF